MVFPIGSYIKANISYFDSYVETVLAVNIMIISNRLSDCYPERIVDRMQVWKGIIVEGLALFKIIGV